MDENATKALHGWVAEFNEEALLADGFEDAFVGMAERCGQPSLAVYDADKCLDVLMQRDGMSYDEAVEFFNFNTLGAWVGEMTPLFLWGRDVDPPCDHAHWDFAKHGRHCSCGALMVDPGD
jgi:hypothetical protein